MCFERKINEEDRYLRMGNMKSFVIRCAHKKTRDKYNWMEQTMIQNGGSSSTTGVAENESIVTEDDARRSMSAGELAVFNAIACAAARKTFLDVIRERNDGRRYELDTSAGRLGRQSIVSDLTSATSVSNDSKIFGARMAIVFKRWKFVSSGQVHYGGKFCEEVFECLGCEMNPTSWEGKNGLKSKATNEISKKRAYLSARLKDIFICE
jgi:hypothetical protein